VELREVQIAGEESKAGVRNHEETHFQRHRLHGQRELSAREQPVLVLEEKD